MNSGILTVISFVSAIFFPWPCTVVVVAITALFEPLVPFAVGLFIDTLYYSPATLTVPYFTLGGFVISIVAFFVRSRLRAGSIR